MQETREPLTEQQEIRDYVSRILCSRDNLEIGSFAISETPLERGGDVCGAYYCLHGPRSLRLTAIWEFETNTILFYGSQGERFQKTRLEAPSSRAPLATPQAA